MKSYKEEILRQLQVRKTTISATLEFADHKINQDHSTGSAAPFLNRQTPEFIDQRERCQNELNKINGCINWINALPS